MLSTELEPHRYTIEDVGRMQQAGVFDERQRLELIDGVIYVIPTPTPPHSSAVALLTTHFVRGCPDHQVRVQDVLLIEGGYVQPDLQVIDPPPAGRHPDTAHLVVEVSVSTIRHDTSKAALYATARVAEYWIVDVGARVVRVHRDPRPDGFGSLTTFEEGEMLQPLLPAPALAVSDLLS